MPQKVQKKMQKSMAAFAQAKKFFPGGVNSPVRAFGAVGGTPPFIAKASGSRVWDIDGNEYIDYVGSWGPAILGHGYTSVIAVLHQALERGTSFGAPTLLETELAVRIQQAMPSLEMIRFVSSGTEATMSALRLARAFTGRSKIIKCEGCYHGHADSLLVKAGSGAATFSIPTSAGVTETTIRDTVVCQYNDLEGMRAVMSTCGHEVAAVILEPVAGNMGCVPPAPGYLQGVRELCTAHGALLIFDEVMTGFRVGFSGAQGLYGIIPDVTCLGKIIGGGLPVGAYGGRADIMQKISPEGPVYQAGTLSGNPLAMSAGIEILTHLAHPDVYARLSTMTHLFLEGISRILQQYGVAHTINQVGSMWTLFLTEGPVTDFASAQKGNHEKFRSFFHGMLKAGISLPPSSFEAAFVSAAHSQSDIEQTWDAVKTAAEGL